MMNFFVGNNINNPRVMVAFGRPDYYNNNYQPEYTGKAIEEIYTFEFLRDADKWLKKESELKLETPPIQTQYWIVDLKTNTTICTGINFPNRFKGARQQFREYYAFELNSTKNLHKYSIKLSIDIEIPNVEAKTYEEAGDKAKEIINNFNLTRHSSEEVHITSYETISAVDEEGKRYFL